MPNEITDSTLNAKIVEALQSFIGHVPTSQEPQSNDPEKRAKEIASHASIKAASVAGTLALPFGPLGLITILPDLIAVWKIQSQMVADIAGAYGKTGFLSQEQMLHCLFKHAAAQSVRDIVVRVGERVIVKRTSLRMIQKTLQKIGVKITQRLIGKGVARWIPVVGALGVAAYAYFDTAKVAENTLEFFGSEITIEADNS